MILGENDNLATTAEEEFLPSKTALFLPVAVIAAGYVLLLAWLWLAGNMSSGIARLAIIVLAIGVPLLLIHAILRYVSTGIRLYDGFLQLNQGFPHGFAANVPFPEIRAIDVRTGFLTRRSGTLVFRLTNGERLAVCDLSRPSQACEAINQRIEASKPGHQDITDESASPAIAASNR